MASNHPEQHDAATDQAVEVVGRSELRAPMSSWYKQLRQVKPGPLLPVLLTVLFVVLSGVGFTLLLSAIDTIIVRLLSAANNANQQLSTPWLLAIIVLALITSWTAIRVPPPGGAGSLFGSGDEGLWETRASFRLPAATVTILLAACLLVWYL